MRRIAILVAMIALTVFQGARACLNEFEGVEVITRPFEAEDWLAGHDQERLHDNWVNDSVSARNALIESKDPDNTSRRPHNYAITLIRLGHADTALDVLWRVEQEHSDMYEVASAIGTAYEFLGRYASAASWLRTVVARNPLRHDNSEWIHLAYVAAEQSLSSNPRWLDTNTILGYDFGDVIDLRSVVWEEDSERLVNVAKEARLHVIDRMPFVTPQDALFAQLLAEYGDLAFRCGDFEYAVLACRKSLQYMSDSVGVIRLRLEAAETELLESRGPATTLWS